MEVSPKNLLEQCTFQEKREISKDIGPSRGKDQSKDVIENASYIACRDLISSSTSIGQEEISDRKTEVILLEKEPDRDHCETASRQVIELSDSDSKMILRRQFGELKENRNSNLQNDSTYYENMEILRKLPPDTVVIRQETRTNKEDSDYRELMETNSSGSSSTSGCTAAKAKRFTRAIRNKTRETVEVRRNPMRVSKKNIDKDFPRSKQRLLVNSRREIRTNYETNKRIKSGTMPYMKTRSVTRKMYTVGATYQAPTKKDETEWKEWPVHGMHERPVYHPQAGLAVEYLGRCFTSLDGLSYCEIIDEPEIEVVAVDPHRDRRAPSIEKKPKGRTKGKSRCSSNAKDTCNTYFSVEDKSFETCMHGSLHCVLGYCSQVITPTYKQAVEERKLTVSTTKSSSEISAKETANVMNNAISSSENAIKFAEKTKIIEAIAIAQNAQKKNVMNNTNGRRITATYPSSSATYIPETQRSIGESDGSKIIPQNGEMIRMNLKRILRDASNNSFILLRNSAAKTSDENCTATVKDVFNPAKLEDVSVDDKTLPNMSSIYKKLILSSEPALGREESSVKNNLYTLKRYSTNTRENTAKKTFSENQLENEKIVHAAKENHKSKSADKIKINRESNDEMLMMSSGKSSTQCSETSEIARILSEYNNSTLRKSAMHNRIYDSKNMKANISNSGAKALPKDFWQKNITAEENQNFTIPDINADLDLLQEKWKRYNVSLGEKSKDNETVNSTQNARNSCSLENNQVFFIDRQMSLNTLKHVKEKSAKTFKEREIVMTETTQQEGKSEYSKDEIEVSTEPLQELLENTAILYCAASGVHQDDLSNYIDTLDSKQSIQWLDSWNNSVV
ncbi:uncharacterized protein LOC126851629 [Cataglyphis hispanica]|uniref:uncharacterized protein LOC126851629 n=1 Tax=Cataglyphis hispanica TaxID=1086592 RepID=UPI00217F6B54|nr:uncharacterized protein LOC126851629 [Cataglyphis hispanica]